MSKRLGRPVIAAVSVAGWMMMSHSWAGSCQTWIVDSTFSLRDAINAVNFSGCTSGGLNDIIIDYVDLAETVIASPLPTIERPAHVRPAAGAPERHVIRVSNNASTTASAALDATARVIIEHLDIQGGSDRDFGAGILLRQGADNSRLIGNRISRTRLQGIFITDVSNVTVEASAEWPSVVIDTGWGVASDPRWAPGILLRSVLDVTITGSYLGVDDDGSVAGNCSYGIEIDDSTLVQLGQSVTDVSARNVIGDNRFGGIRVIESNAINILGNYIGLGTNGLDPVGNGNAAACFPGTPPVLQQAGIAVVDSGFVGIGATNVNQASYITDNVHGIVLVNAQSVTLLRNNIGGRPNGSTLANRVDAIQIGSGSGLSGGILIGSDTPGLANRIVGDSNSRHGVNLLAGTGRVDIRSNPIYDHDDQPINRSVPPDLPVLVSANPANGLVTGNLVPVNLEGEVDLFIDLAGETQARYYLGTVSVPAMATSFSVSVSSPNFLDGRPVTATFTANGPGSAGTSRLSAPVIAESEDAIFADQFEQP